MKKHSACGVAKAVKSAVKSIFVHDILLLMCQKQSSFPDCAYLHQKVFVCWKTETVLLKLLLTACMPTFNYSVFKSRPKDISKACLSLPTTKTHQDKPFWQLSIVAVNLPGLWLLTFKVHTFRIWFTIQFLDHYKQHFSTFVLTCWCKENVVSADINALICTIIWS